jgi:hypothetical protein
MTFEDRLPGLGPKGDRPRLNSRADLTTFTLTPTEGFVLSRVDGTMSYEQICRVVGGGSGIGADGVQEILRRLKSEGLIMGPNERTPPPVVTGNRGTPVQGVPHSPSSATSTTGTRPAMTSLLDRLDDGSPVDPADMLTGPDLAPEVKMRVIRLHRRLKKLSPHEMLGLPRDADRQTIKRAYYGASKELHPDRYYGKDLGHFREKLGDIFARLTEAFQSLDKK